ncbi:hypothetical protein A0H77_19460 [Vibrio alginolyticus]|uniref:hypothetical protein n=1 Tax=Vibrio alginolyticus TaxID=663 RepID=UPI000796FED8|nr:hypothetical protein [Vibrio alginolyticus]KXZ35076.1 hypothetical protein A0H77_19460 [Vibrio alginolyticus]
MNLDKHTNIIPICEFELEKLKEENQNLKFENRQLVLIIKLLFLTPLFAVSIFYMQNHHQTKMEVSYEDVKR